MSFWPFNKRHAPRLEPPSPASSSSSLFVPAQQRPALPLELWILILEHIHDDKDLYKIRTLNHSIRILAIDKQYREVDFFNQRNKWILRNVQLFCDRPNFASRVQSLKLNSQASSNACQASFPPKSKTRTKVNKKFKDPEFHNPIDDSSLFHVTPKLRVLAMQDAAQNLQNVKNLYYIMNFSNYHCPLFTTLLPLISPSLQTLFLNWRNSSRTNANDPRTVLVRWETEIFQKIQMPNLKSLTILLVARFPNFDKTFQYFIESIPSTLQYLSIQFSRHDYVESSFLPTNLPIAFRKLTALKTLVISFPMCLDENDQLLDHTPLHQLLRTINSASGYIRNLRIVSQACGIRKMEITKELAREWYAKCLEGVRYDNLKTEHICPERPLPPPPPVPSYHISYFGPLPP